MRPKGPNRSFTILLTQIPRCQTIGSDLSYGIILMLINKITRTLLSTSGSGLVPSDNNSLITFTSVTVPLMMETRSA